MTTTELPRFARDQAFGVILAATAAVAWIASVILVLERLELYRDASHVTSCDLNPWVSCGTVMQTWQAALFGFPNPFIGVVGFAVVLTIGVSLAAGARFPRWYWIGVQTGITLAAAFIGWLWYQALFEINVLCLYCIVVWLMVIPLFIYTTARNILHGVLPAPAWLRRAAAGWPGVATALVIVACAASIFFRFMNMFLG
ncbi:vitamin K epoxide reductase family protein [Zafaria sp. Z1313]|uniref:vitamin K epoxide reductase family protein n=1 Tax=unclassified Zafaria TaxID=2828765 RepID=UPI002E78E16C|nr:vitamin K epoxide reductase family protein [Zafaria sp. J156]MEE1622477.1 vitamin K epoxide reductase family protein [Zafaria sp. J156]